MDNLEKLPTQVIQDNNKKKWKQKHNTIFVGHHYGQANTNNVNKTWAHLQTTWGKDEPNIVFVLQSPRTSQDGNQNDSTTQKKTWATRTLPKHSWFSSLNFLFIITWWILLSSQTIFCSNIITFGYSQIIIRK